MAGLTEQQTWGIGVLYELTSLGSHLCHPTYATPPMPPHLCHPTYATPPMPPIRCMNVVLVQYGRGEVRVQAHTHTHTHTHTLLYVNVFTHSMLIIKCIPLPFLTAQSVLFARLSRTCAPSLSLPLPCFLSVLQYLCSYLFYLFIYLLWESMTNSQLSRYHVCCCCCCYSYQSHFL